MAEIAALRERARSVKQTLKITGAMYLLSQAKSRKARGALDTVSPFFDEIYDTIADVLHHSTEVKHPFFGTAHSPEGEGQGGIVVISGDKGLAGAYNSNICNLALEKGAEYRQSTFYVVGEMGRRLLAQKGAKVEEEFDYPATDPTLSRAWEMSRLLVRLFKEARLREIWLAYTHVVSPLVVEPRLFPLLPLDLSSPFWQEKGGAKGDNRLIYVPSVDAVISRLVPVFLAGVLYSAMVEAFCSENSSRMNAMKTASENGKEMLDKLTLRYNRLRQDAITAQIIEVAGGSDAAH